MENTQRPYRTSKGSNSLHSIGLGNFILGAARPLGSRIQPSKFMTTEARKSSLESLSKVYREENGGEVQGVSENDERSRGHSANMRVDSGKMGRSSSKEEEGPETATRSQTNTEDDKDLSLGESASVTTHSTTDEIDTDDDDVDSRYEEEEMAASPSLTAKEMSGSMVKRQRKVVNKTWNAEETAHFLDILEKCGIGNWKQISELVGDGFTSDKCRKRWNSLAVSCHKKSRRHLPDDLWNRVRILRDRGTKRESPRKQKIIDKPLGTPLTYLLNGPARSVVQKPWTEPMIKLFLDAIERHGVGNWNDIRNDLNFSPHYSADHYRKRWISLQSARPGVKRGRFHLSRDLWNRFQTISEKVTTKRKVGEKAIKHEQYDDEEEEEEFEKETTIKRERRRRRRLTDIDEELVATDLLRLATEPLRAALHDHPAYDEHEGNLQHAFNNFLGLRIEEEVMVEFSSKMFQMAKINDTRHTSSVFLLKMVLQSMEMKARSIVPRSMKAFATVIDSIVWPETFRDRVPLSSFEILSRASRGLECSPSVEAFIDAENNLGVQTTKPMRKGDFVGVFIGKVFFEREYRRHRVDAPFVTDDMDAELFLIENSRKTSIDAHELSLYVCASGMYGNESCGNLTCLVKDSFDKDPNVIIIDVNIGDVLPVPVMFILEDLEAGTELYCLQSHERAMDIEEAKYRRERNSSNPNLKRNPKAQGM